MKDIEIKENETGLRQNVFCVGLTIEAIILPGEKIGDFNFLSGQMAEHFKPVGLMEEILVKRISSTYWRLLRCQRAEASMIRHQIESAKELDATQDMKDLLSEEPDDPLLAPKLVVTDPELYEAARTKANQAKERLHDPNMFIGRSFNTLQDKLANIVKYEAGLERILQKSIFELQQLQSNRKKWPSANKTMQKRQKLQNKIGVLSISKIKKGDQFYADR